MSEASATEPAALRRRRRLSSREYVEGVLAGNRVILAQAITLIESRLESDAQLAHEVLEGVLPHTGRARRVGITGVPGVGKSTFIDALGLHMIRGRGERLAVLSVDPSSPVSHGSILGDKTRMEKLSLEEQAFIRPSPARGHLGGVALRTRETILLCEAAGYQNILVETVGVGQSETAVRSMTDCFVLLMIAGAGDELQGIKRGIIEMVDLMAINKADGDNRAKAERARAEYASALHLLARPADGWTAPVVTCSAITGEGVAPIWDLVLEHRATLQSNGWLDRRRHQQALEWMRELVIFGLEEQFHRSPLVERNLSQIQEEVVAGRLSPFSAARRLLDFSRCKE
ncbi:MAG: methylmalonyl Co-A mutase-associated GTPase MeaB [Bryobacterales bacterium]|nr:methylmalonyl Co-A mutase-associated GTPase MeaB [Bryobacterales bacterium]